MSCKLKALGFGIAAAFAIGAVSASAASAEAVFHATGSTHTILSATALNTQVLEDTATGSKIECTTFGGSGTIATETASEFVFSPEASGCIAKIGGTTYEARATITGCTYRFTNETQGSHYETHIECPLVEGVRQEIHIEVFAIGKWRLCYTIPQQTPTEQGVTFSETGEHLDINATIKGIELTKATGPCGPAGTVNNVDYTGKVTVSGTNTASENVDLDFP